jgi:hypothetical protein
MLGDSIHTKLTKRAVYSTIITYISTIRFLSQYAEYEVATCRVGTSTLWSVVTATSKYDAGIGELGH